MRDPQDPGLEAIEQRLLARAGVATPAGHRDRVLAAVQEKVSATKSGEAGRLRCADCPDLVADTFLGIDAGGRAALLAMALSASLVIVAPWFAVATSVAPVQAEPRLVTQARAAGIDLPLAAVAATGDLPRHVPAGAALPALPERRRLEAWRLHKNLLQGEL
jgi:hypothetical protein